jgi:hypothetical protein
MEAKFIFILQYVIGLELPPKILMFAIHQNMMMIFYS